MARRKKVDLNNVLPLQSIKIGRIKTNKYGWIGSFFLIGLFIGIVYYLPELPTIYQKYILGINVKKEKINNNENTNTADNIANNTSIKTDEEPKKPLIYFFGDTEKIEVQNLSFENIKAENNTLSFNVKLSDENNIIDLEEQKLYFVIYDKNDNVINNIALLNNIDTDNLNIYQIGENAQSFMIKQISSSEYPKFSLIEGVNSLVCSNSNEKVTFIFDGQKLVKIRMNANYNSGERIYEYKKAEYEYLNDKYSNKTGISLNFNSDNGLNLRFNINYEEFDGKIDYSGLDFHYKNRIFFSKGELAKNIKFKMEAMQYNCS